MNEIKGTTKVCALIGNPTGHSLSPQIHNNLARMTGIDMAYTTFSPEKDNLKKAVEGAFALGIEGLNVTVPYKEAVMESLVGIDPLAKALGAVNTLVRKEDGYYGCNTDITGFARSIKEAGFDFKGRSVVILGAGGAARAVAFAAATEGASDIHILNRTKQKADSIKEAVYKYFDEKSLNDRPEISTYTLDEDDKVEACDFLLVQTTNVGMYPNTRDIILEDSSLYDRAAFGFDIVYNPQTTAFLRKLREKKVRAVNGLFMLLYQGIEAYRYWYPEAKITPQMERRIARKLKEELFSSNNKRQANRAANENIILVGFMGSGKTTLGKWISAKTGRIWIDIDKEIEKNEGMKISDIFEQYGEEGFRNRETQYLKDLLKENKKNLVISTGGGTPLRKENRDILKKLGTVVYLRASDEELYHRLKYDTKRPVLFGTEKEERRKLISDILKQREPAYLDGASITVRTDGVYFPKIYGIIHKKMKDYRYRGYRWQNRFALSLRERRELNEKRRKSDHENPRN